MLSIAEKLATIYENEFKVYEAGRSAAKPSSDIATLIDRTTGIAYTVYVDDGKFLRVSSDDVWIIAPAFNAEEVEF